MSKWEKLLARITSLSKDLRFEELRRVLESCGYTMHAPRGSSSHYTFRKPGCISSGETLERAIENARDAKRAWLDAALEDGLPISEPGSLDDYSGQFKLRLPRSLHRALAERSRLEGVSMNQYCVYLLSRGA